MTLLSFILAAAVAGAGDLPAGTVEIRIRAPGEPPEQAVTLVVPLGSELRVVDRDVVAVSFPRAGSGAGSAGGPTVADVEQVRVEARPPAPALGAVGPEPEEVRVPAVPERVIIEVVDPVKEPVESLEVPTLPSPEVLEILADAPPEGAGPPAPPTPSVVVEPASGEEFPPAIRYIRVEDFMDFPPGGGSVHHAPAPAGGTSREKGSGEVEPGVEPVDAPPPGVLDEGEPEIEDALESTGTSEEG